jgi:[ribosomal protein S5]-alanine N-acetyltransferase
VSDQICTRGKKIYLREPCVKDVSGRWWEWLNDYEVTAFMNKGIERNTPKKQLLFFQNVMASEKDIVMAICDLNTDQHIGTVALHNINDDGIAQFGIILGEKAYWGKGVGSEAWKMMIHYGFEQLKLKSIYTKVFSENIAALKIAKKCGFKEEKRLVGELVKNGIKYDRILIQVKRCHWEKL